MLPQRRPTLNCRPAVCTQTKSVGSIERLDATGLFCVALASSWYSVALTHFGVVVVAGVVVVVVVVCSCPGSKVSRRNTSDASRDSELTHRLTDKS